MMILEDIRLFNKRVHNRSYRYFIGLSVVFVTSVFKELVMLCHDIHHMHDKDVMPMTNLFKDKYKDHLDSSEQLEIFLKTKSNMSAQSILKPQKKLSISSLSKSKALATLRSYFLSNTEIKGKILQTKFPKVPLEDLVNSYKYNEDCKPFLVQQITFGQELDVALSEAFGYKLKRNKLTRSTCLVFNNGKIHELELTLHKIFYNDKIIVKVVNTKTSKK